MALELPEDMVDEIGQQLTLETKKKILGENAARLYEINIPERAGKLGLNFSGDGVSQEPAYSNA